MPASRSVVAVLLRELGDFLYTLNAGPAAAALGRRHDRHGGPGAPSHSGDGSNRTASLGDARIRTSQTWPTRLIRLGWYCGRLEATIGLTLILIAMEWIDA
jgi:hypothetical protein